MGDLIDRGPQTVEAVGLARAMVEARSALIVAGNHEFNAAAYATPDPDDADAYLRVHSDKNYCQHARFLEQAPFGGPLQRNWTGITGQVRR